MRKFILILMGLGVIMSSLALATPANAATSSAPTMYAPSVARGKTIPARINAHGSKIVSKTNTLWKSGHRRVTDWSPRPGLYNVKSVIRYRIKTSTWVSDPECLVDYSDRDCKSWGEGHSTATYGSIKSVTRYDAARVSTNYTPGCVSYREFKAVKNGMTQTKVRSIFGASGKLISSGSFGTSREYQTCEGNSWSYVWVDFSPRVSWKWRYIDWS